MMDYIHVHKPGPISTTTTKTPKRKSTSGRKSMVKKAESIIQNNFHDPTRLAFQAFEKKLNNIKKEIHEDVFNSIYVNTTEYFNYYLQRRVECNLGNQYLNDKNNIFIFNPISHVIPTIALFTGINFQDYASLCENFSDKLQRNFTKHMFLISEKNSQNMKTLVNSIVSQHESNMDFEVITKKSMFSFRNLFEEIKSSQEQKSEKPNSIIFVFKQFELIPKETVEQFVSLVSCYVENIPIYFVIELASQSNILYEQLSSSVISKLCVKRLYLMSPELYLDKFITKLFIEQSTMFKLSGDIVQYLVEIYYDYNYSISSLIHALKLCYYDHLQNNDFNQLYLTPHITEYDLYEAIAAQGSKNDADKKILYESLNLHMNNYQESWIKYNNQFSLIVHFLFEIVKNFPSEQETESFFSINTKSFSDFYVKICSLSKSSQNKKSFTELSQFANLKSLLKISSANTINDIVLSLTELIKAKSIDDNLNYSTKFLNDIHDLEEILLKLKLSFSATINESLNEHDENTTENTYFQDKNDILNSEPNSKSFMPKPALIRRRSSRMTKVLGEINSDQTKKQATQRQAVIITQKRPTTATCKTLTQNMIQWLEVQFQTYFDQDYSVDLNNSNHFCYTDLEKIKKRLYDIQRLNIHSCLFNMTDFIKMKIKGFNTDFSPVKKAKNKISTDNGSYDSEDFMPLSIIYRVYLECGHMINLYDWLQAFVERVENVDIKELSTPKRKLMQALFFRSITELQFLGLIKPTNRKVDHVVKLTNGSSLLSMDENYFKMKINYH